MGGPVVLVGHSYGGSIITPKLAIIQNVAALVYYMPPLRSMKAKGCASIEQALPQATTAFPNRTATVSGGWSRPHFTWLTSQQKTFHGMGKAGFAWQLSRKCRFLPTRSLIRSRTRPPGTKTHLVHGGKRRTDRSIRIRSAMAKRAKAKTVEVSSSHVAYMSHPKEAAKLIEEAATSAGAHQSAAG